MRDLSCGGCNNTSSGSGADGKHISQHSSLISHLRELAGSDAFSSDEQSCFIEFGSGVGRLSDQLQEETGAAHLHMMIDRDHFKSTRLRDKAMTKRRAVVCGAVGSTAAITRITDDIKNVCLETALSECYGVTHTSARVIAISKHLCGKGLDM